MCSSDLLPQLGQLRKAAQDQGDERPRQPRRAAPAAKRHPCHLSRQFCRRKVRQVRYRSAGPAPQPANPLQCRCHRLLIHRRRLSPAPQTRSPGPEITRDLRTAGPWPLNVPGPKPGQVRFCARLRIADGLIFDETAARHSRPVRSGQCPSQAGFAAGSSVWALVDHLFCRHAIAVMTGADLWGNLTEACA